MNTEERTNRIAEAIQNARQRESEIREASDSLRESLSYLQDELHTIRNDWFQTIPLPEEVTKALERVEHLISTLNGCSFASFAAIQLRQALEQAWKELP